MYKNQVLVGPLGELASTYELPNVFTDANKKDTVDSFNARPQSILSAPKTQLNDYNGSQSYQTEEKVRTMGED